MNEILPFITFLVGLLIGLGVAFYLNSRTKNRLDTEIENLAEGMKGGLSPSFP